jgi:retron-type reverse transcriptase
MSYVALLAGGDWNNGAACGARAVNMNNYPWHVHPNVGARCACDFEDFRLFVPRDEGTTVELEYRQSGRNACLAQIIARRNKKGKRPASSTGEKRVQADEMKRYGNLYEHVCEFENLHKAYLKARRCKRYRSEVLRYTSNLEENLTTLRNDLVSHTYKQGKFRTFAIFEPKQRTIKALPFRDRVAQHAVNNVIEPLIDKRFYEHSYACRVGKGMHLASSNLTEWIRDMSKRGAIKLWALKADIKGYFASVDHAILKKALARIFKDRELEFLLNHIIDNGIDKDAEDRVGIPIGNLSSQLFANLYLDVFDKYLKENLKVRYYMRYMDDFLILSNDKEELKGLLR